MRKRLESYDVAKLTNRMEGLAGEVALLRGRIIQMEQKWRGDSSADKPARPVEAVKSIGEIACGEKIPAPAIYISPKRSDPGDTANAPHNAAILTSLFGRL